MKKVTTILLVICTILSSGLLSACSHKCSFEENWATDEFLHWHACSDPSCIKTADKDNHTWDSGVITTPATQEVSGVKTFTCAVCKHTKTQAFTYLGMSEEEWYWALDYSQFANFTYTEKTVVKKPGLEVTTITVYEIQNTKAKVTETLAGETVSAEIPSNEVDKYRKFVWAYCGLMADYSNYRYDARSRSYVLKGIFNIPTWEVPADTATLKFKDGKLTEITYTGKVREDGKIYYITSTITLTKYGVTKIS